MVVYSRTTFNEVFSYLTANDKIAQEYDQNTNQQQRVENKIYLMGSFSYTCFEYVKLENAHIHEKKLNMCN